MISFAYPAREHQVLGRAIEQAVAEVLRGGRYILGPKVREFEERLASWTGARAAVGVSSGTDALVCALAALGIGPGDEVLVPVFGFVAAPEAVVRVGAKPVFVDIQSNTLGPDPEACVRARTERTKALVVMHLFGQAVDLEPLLQALPGLCVIEDAAQAMGTTHRGRHVALTGDVGVLSFFPAKALGAAGDAGAVLLHRRLDLLEASRKCRLHGAVGPYDWQMVSGGNYRLDELQAAVLLVKLQALGERLERRRRYGQRLVRELREAGFRPLVGAPDSEPAYSPLAVLVDDRDRFVERMRRGGVDVRVQYPKLLAEAPVFSRFVQSADRFAVADSVRTRVASIPCSPEMTEEELETECRAIREAGVS